MYIGSGCIFHVHTACLIDKNDGNVGNLLVCVLQMKVRALLVGLLGWLFHQFLLALGEALPNAFVRNDSASRFSESRNRFYTKEEKLKKVTSPGIKPFWKNPTKR